MVFDKKLLTHVNHVHVQSLGYYCLLPIYPSPKHHKIIVLHCASPDVTYYDLDVPYTKHSRFLPDITLYVYFLLAQHHAAMGHLYEMPFKTYSNKNISIQPNG